MTPSTTHRTRIEADPDLPTIRIVRDFDARPDRVYRAWTDPELVIQWMGPRTITMQIDVWDATTDTRSCTANTNGTTFSWSSTPITPRT